MDSLSKDNDIIEIETGNEAVGIDVPFDPNQIRIDSPPTNVGDIIDRLENGEIMLDTEFQRLPDLWDDVKKSRFIESLLLKLPIPKFYFDGQDDNKWRVIDGLQRVSTFKSFMKEKMPLQGLEFLKEYESKTFDELPRPLQRRIRVSPLTVVVLEKGTPDVVKYLLFSRINQSGLMLTPQEIRHAMHQGKASNLIKELVDKDNEMGQSFIKVTEGKIPTKRMEHRDFAARFVAFYLLSYENYKPDMDSFINAGMAAISKLSASEIEQLKSDFKKAMETAYAIFGNDAFRKRFNEHDKRQPINKALFEVMSVNLAQCSDQEREILVVQKDFFKEELMQLYFETRFGDTITQGTALQFNVVVRFRVIQKIIKATLDFQKGLKSVYAILGDNAVEKINNIFETDTLANKIRKRKYDQDYREYNMMKILIISLGKFTEKEINVLINRRDVFQMNLKKSAYSIDSKAEQVKIYSENTFNITDLNTNKKPYLLDIFKDIENVIKTTLEHA